MRIVVVGAGKVGILLCATLSGEGHEVTLIEQKQEVLKNTMENCEILGVVGNGSFYDVQVRAQVQHADMFISVTAEDEVNIVSCVIAKKLGAKYTIARVRTPEHQTNMGFAKESLGISQMINPDLEAAREIYRALQFPAALSVEPFINGKVNLVELLITKDSILKGLNMAQFRRKYPGIIGCIISRDDASLIPDGQSVLKEDDHFFVTGGIDDLRSLYKTLGNLERIQSVFVVGGGRITRYLLHLLRNSKKDIRVVEQKEVVANDLAELYENVDIICGDGTDQNLLLEERFDTYDCLISMTGIDEENIILSMFATKSGVPRTITKMSRTNLLPLAYDVGIQTVIVPAKTGATAILRYVRSISNVQSSHIESMYRLVDGAFEILQFFVRPSFKGLNTTLKDLDLRKDVLIALVIRNNTIIFPTGATEIHVSDRIIVVSRSEHTYDLNDILRTV